MFRIEDNVYVNGQEHKRIKKDKPKDYSYVICQIKTLPKRIEIAKKNGNSILAKNLTEKLEFYKKQLKEEQNIQKRSHKIIKQSKKKRTDAEAKKMIMKYINEVKKGKRKGARVTSLAVAKEDVAYSLMLPENQVEKIFMILNREGILSQRNAEYVHDSTRNDFAFGPYSGWASDYYNILI